LDPIAHTFAGAALAVSGLRRKTPLATATLLIGANAPDVDVVAAFGAPFQELAFRRGWTHGVLALAVLPFLVAAHVLLFDRYVRRKARPSAERARPGPVLTLAALAVLTHPILDWLNNYGLRWLMPFDGRWFYGDAVFIIDPWLWLGLGGVAFLAYSRRWPAMLRWSVLWLLASALVLTTAGVPLGAKVLWLGGIAALLALRGFRVATPERPAGIERGARIVLVCAVVYIGALVLGDFAERAAVRTELAARGIASIERVMVAPVPANPFAGEVVAEGPSDYYVGSWRWLPEPKLTLLPETIPKRAFDPIYVAAAQTIEARRFLTWARFPYIDVESSANGHLVRFRDARYRSMGVLTGPTVRLDRELRPLPDVSR
jgi:inner membrane protein